MASDADADVDVSGLVCPRPNQVVRRCLAALDAGETLLVRGDYPPAERSIRRSCYKHGFPVAAAERETADGEFALRIRVPDADSSEVDRASDGGTADGGPSEADRSAVEGRRANRGRPSPDRDR